MEKEEIEIIERLSETISKMNDSQKQFFIGYAQGMAAAIVNQQTDSQKKQEEVKNDTK